MRRRYLSVANQIAIFVAAMIQRTGSLVPRLGQLKPAQLEARTYIVITMVFKVPRKKHRCERERAALLYRG